MTLRRASIERLRQLLGWQHPEPSPAATDAPTAGQNDHAGPKVPASLEAAAAWQRAAQALHEAELGSEEIHAIAGRMKREREINHFAPLVYRAMKADKK